MALEYTFEKMSNNRYQVRLYGWFVTYADKNDPKIVDNLLKEHGWETREDYFEYLISESESRRNEV